MYFLAKNSAKKYTVWNRISQLNKHLNRVLYGEKFSQKVHGSNAYLAAKFYFKRCTFWRKIWPKSIRFKCLSIDESKILRSKKIKVVTPHEKCRFWFKYDNTKPLPGQFGYVLFKKMFSKHSETILSIFEQIFISWRIS